MNFFHNIPTSSMFKLPDDQRTWIKVDCMTTGYYYNAQEVVNISDMSATQYCWGWSVERIIVDDNQEVMEI